MALDLFAGHRVSDYVKAREWYMRLVAAEPSFMPHATEAVWELAEHRFLYIVEDRENPGGGMITVFVDDLDQRVERISARGIEPVARETYGNGVRKVTFRDDDGNETGFGGAAVQR